MLARLFALLLLLLPGAVFSSLLDDSERFPADHRELRGSLTVEEMADLIVAADAMEHISVVEVGESAEGRAIPLVHVRPAEGGGWWRVLLIGIQHGDEPAGRMAIAYLLRELANNPDMLPGHVDLWLLPEINPDAVVNNQRRNADGVDLNRDHLVMAAPETRIMHRVVRRLRPHVTVDAHEYSRDTRSWIEAGMLRPLIMMDTANHPLFPASLYRAGVDWVGAAEEAMNETDHSFSRYFVGGPPPHNEQRFSTLEADDARNGLGSYGGLSFIIESGVTRRADDPDADLGARVDAYLHLFRLFMDDEERARRDARLVDEARRSALPDFLPTNSFWGNAEWREYQVPVEDTMTGLRAGYPTRTFMQDRITKASAPTPRGYVIPGEFADRFKPLLEAHGIAFREIAEGDSTTQLVEPCVLVRIEDDYDNVYVRFEGRQIVRVARAEERTFGEGALVVSLDQELAWRVAILLEPAMMYGLYQYNEFRDLAVEGEELPVLRLARLP